MLRFIQLVGYVVVFNLVLSGGEKNGNYRYSLFGWYHDRRSCVFLVHAEAVVRQQVRAQCRQIKNQLRLVFYLPGQPSTSFEFSVGAMPDERLYFGDLPG